MYKLTAFVFFAGLIAGCGSTVDPKNAGTSGKARLEQLKEQQAQINEEIRTLEEQLASTDTAVANSLNAKLVEVASVSTENFTHYIDLQGKVEAENIAYVTPRGMGGQVESVHVKQGDYVKKGQLLLKLDNAVVKQQIDQVNVQLSLAETLYERRKNLWEKQIGTEVELLQAKNNVDNLKKQLELLNEQLQMTNVHAAISGVADMVNIKVGEYFTAQTANVMGIRIVNTSDLKVTTQVPENYLHKVREGATVQVNVPGLDKPITTKISVKGRTIDPASRSFYIEAKIPSSQSLRPNQLVMVKIQDYASDSAVTIPMNTLQNDENGKYVMLAVNENGRMVAKKRTIQVGELYGNDLEVKSGLTAEDVLITEGFQGLYDGQPVVVKENN